jgi:hypothetical protein
VQTTGCKKAEQATSRLASQCLIRVHSTLSKHEKRVYCHNRQPAEIIKGLAESTKPLLTPRRRDHELVFFVSARVYFASIISMEL